MDRKKIRSNFDNEDMNPCIEESKLSTKCMRDNNYDSEKCGIFFSNYNNCKRFWNIVSRERRMAGIKPAIPTAEERKKIMLERLNKKKADESS